MKDFTSRQEKFYKRWTEKRKRKYLFLFLSGSVYWGIPVALIIYLWDKNFELNKLNYFQLFRNILVFMAGGLLVGYGNFRMNEKLYKKMWDANNEIQ